MFVSPPVKIVVDLPAGTTPEGTPNAQGKYCYNWNGTFCWTYDDQNNQLIYEGGVNAQNHHVYYSLSHADSPYYLDSANTNIKYHKVTNTVTVNPDTDKERVGSHTASIGWVPQIVRETPTSSFTLNKQ